MAETPCPHCGHHNEISANYCSSCGAELQTQEPTGELPAIHTDEDEFGDVDRSAFGPHEGLFVVVQGPKSGARYALDSDVVAIGRHPQSDIFFNDVTVSRRHAEVYRDGHQYRVKDVGSLNGTYVNRDLIDEHLLEEGDEVQVGKFKLVFAYGTGEV